MFLQDNPIGPGDRVLAGLSVAFDASCEEMWLAWRHGACLVPAPRSLVRSGMDLGPWLVSRDITVVSTVPTLAALWPAEALEAVRLLIFGGEACPPELAERLAVDGPRGVEHLRPDRGHRRRVRGPARRHGPGPHRAAAGRLGPGRRRRRRAAGRLRRGRRTGHRRRRAGPLPRPGQGRREVRADADARAGTAPTAAATWSGSNPTACSSRAAPTTRSRSAAGGSSSARSTRRWWTCPASAAARPRCAAPPAATRCWSATSPARTRTFDLAAARAALAESAARRAGAAAGAASTNCRPARRARSTATRCRGRSPGAERRRRTRPRRHHGLAGRAVARRARRAESTGPRPTSSPSAAARCRPRSWWPRCAQRYPQVTVADLYDHPRLGSLAGFLDELDPPPAVEPRDRAADAACSTQAAQVAAVAAAGHADRAAVADLAGAGQQRRSPRCTWCRGLVPLNWWWVARGVRAVHHPARAGWASRCSCARMLLSRRASRAPTAAAGRCTCGCGSPSGWPTPAAPRTWPARRGWCTTPARWAQGRQGVDLHSAAAGDRDAHARPPLLGRTRGRPVRALDRRRRLPRRARSPIGNDATVGARTHAAARRGRSARTPRSRRVPAWSARSRTASTGRARPR